jgi:hypothetical protein
LRFRKAFRRARRSTSVGSSSEVAWGRMLVPLHLWRATEYWTVPGQGRAHDRARQSPLRSCSARGEMAGPNRLGVDRCEQRTPPGRRSGSVSEPRPDSAARWTCLGRTSNGDKGRAGTNCHQGSLVNAGKACCSKVGTRSDSGNHESFLARSRCDVGFRQRFLGGQSKTGHLSTLQNRPFPVSGRDQ